MIDYKELVSKLQTTFSVIYPSDVKSPTKKAYELSEKLTRAGLRHNVVSISSLQGVIRYRSASLVICFLVTGKLCVMDFDKASEWLDAQTKDRIVFDDQDITSWVSIQDTLLCLRSKLQRIKTSNTGTTSKSQILTDEKANYSYYSSLYDELMDLLVEAQLLPAKRKKDSIKRMYEKEASHTYAIVYDDDHDEFEFIPDFDDTIY